MHILYFFHEDLKVSVFGHIYVICSTKVFWELNKFSGFRLNNS